jgi:hypothetical protein
MSRRKFTRTPMAEIVRRSPFDGLLSHNEKAKECISILKDAMEAYCDEEWERFEELTNKIIKIEHEADLIKGNIRAHLPKSIFMPVDKSAFLDCLREEDAILDYAEDASVWLKFKRNVIPNEFREDFLKHLEKVIECVNAYDNAVKEVKALVRGAVRQKDREKAKQAIKETHRKEWEADEVEKRLTKNIFSADLDPLSIFHLIKVVELIGEIADHAENAGDRLRMMFAK